MFDLASIMAMNGVTELPEQTRRMNKESARREAARQARRANTPMGADAMCEDAARQRANHVPEITPLSCFHRVVERAQQLAAEADALESWAEEWAYGLPVESTSAVVADSDMVLVTYIEGMFGAIPCVFSLSFQLIVVDGEPYSLDVNVKHPSLHLLGEENVALLMEVADVNSIAALAQVHLGLPLVNDDRHYQGRHLGFLCAEAAAADAAMRGSMYRQFNEAVAADCRRAA